MEQPKSKDPQKELEIALSELEERVDRLRASYEQYFMGYEKIEPGVQRKDVDRRFTVLRKQQIRNTALRFRFNVITQKFNTYSMYWTRICRQIEEGTYKRHVVKAAKRFGGQAANKREQDWSIDVELGDFEDADMDAILAEADAAAEAYGRAGQPADTVPPGATMTTEPPPPPSARKPAGPVSAPTSPETSFSMSGGRETVGGDGPSSERLPAAAHLAPRAARHAPLPPGAKQPLLVRRRTDDNAPPPSAPGIRAPSASSPDRVGPPSSSVIRPSPVSSPASHAGRPAPAPASSASASSTSPSAGRLPIAAPSSVRVPAAAPSSAARVPIAPGAPPSTGGPRVPASGPAASSGRLPAAPASGGAIRPASPSSPQPAAPRAQGYRPAALPPSANRVPVAQGSSPRTPAAPIARSAEPAGAKLPGSPASAPRAPATSSGGPDSAPGSDQPRPSRRPPPPLPGHVKKNS